MSDNSISGKLKGKQKLHVENALTFENDPDSDGATEVEQVNSINMSNDSDFADTSTTLFDGESPRQVSYSAGDFAESSFSESANSEATQLQYHSNVVSLDRGITSTLKLLEDLQTENSNRGIHYPTIANNGNQDLNDIKSVRALQRKNTAELLKALATENDSRTPKALEIPADDISFQVLQLNLKMNGNYNSNIGSSLDDSAVSQLLEDNFQQISKHLLSLRKRIDDNSSRVFVTGDLNAGKSTFCNALLRRKLLPEDQQPCTNIFCEVIDCRENDGMEEVHAVCIGSTYDRHNGSTYKKFLLQDLEDLVGEHDKYSILKVYVDDKLPVTKSLLRNGLVDIKIIDAPGLNMDSYQTTEVFSRQEEIDLVVFVVSAENHFTLSAREFISSAVKEKQLIFIVVNKFDSIKNKDKCTKRILDQVQSLSPETHKSARDFVHFVSSSDELNGSPGANPGDDHNDDDDNGVRRNPDFDRLADSLKRFILEKRSISKLAPAKNFLLKILNDLETLSKFNQEYYCHEKESVSKSINELIPVCDKQITKSELTVRLVDQIIEDVTSDVYQFSKDRINKSIESSLSTEKNEFTLNKDFDFLTFNFIEFAKSIQDSIINDVLNSVEVSEAYTKKKAVELLDEIIRIGRTNLEDEDFLKFKVFREDLMFQRSKHYISKNLKRNIDFFDFFDPSLHSFFKLVGLPDISPYLNVNVKEIFATFNWKSSLSLLLVGSSTQLLVTKNIFMGLTNNYPILRPILSSSIFLKISLTAGIAATAYYLISDIPYAFKRNFGKKLKKQITELDYVDSNAMRISKECRLVLSYPSMEITKKFELKLSNSLTEKQTLMKKLKHADSGIKFHKDFGVRCVLQKNLIDLVAL